MTKVPIRPRVQAPLTPRAWCLRSIHQANANLQKVIGDKMKLSLLSRHKMSVKEKTTSTVDVWRPLSGSYHRHTNWTIDAAASFTVLLSKSRTKCVARLLLDNRAGVNESCSYRLKQAWRDIIHFTMSREMCHFTRNRINYGWSVRHKEIWHLKVHCAFRSEFPSGLRQPDFSTEKFYALECWNGRSSLSTQGSWCVIDIEEKAVFPLREQLTASCAGSRPNSATTTKPSLETSSTAKWIKYLPGPDPTNN